MAGEAGDGDEEWTPPYAWRRRLGWEKKPRLQNPVNTRRAKQATVEKVSEQKEFLPEEMYDGRTNPSKENTCSEDSPIVFSHSEPQRNNSIAAIKHIFVPKAKLKLMKRDLLHKRQINCLPERYKRYTVALKQLDDQARMDCSEDKFSNRKSDQHNFKSKSITNNHNPFPLKRNSGDIPEFPPKKRMRPCLSVTISESTLFRNTERLTESKQDILFNEKKFTPNSAAILVIKSDAGKSTSTHVNVGMEFKNSNGSEDKVHHDLKISQQSDVSTWPQSMIYKSKFHPTNRKLPNIRDEKKGSECDGNPNKFVNISNLGKRSVGKERHRYKNSECVGCLTKKSTRIDEKRKVRRQDENSRRIRGRHDIPHTDKLTISKNKYFKVVPNLSRGKDLKIEKNKIKTRKNLSRKKEATLVSNEITKRKRDKPTIKENSNLKAGMALNSCLIAKKGCVISHCKSVDADEKGKNHDSETNLKPNSPFSDRFPIVLCQKVNSLCNPKSSKADDFAECSNDQINGFLAKKNFDPSNEKVANRDYLEQTNKVSVNERQITFNACKSFPDKTSTKVHHSNCDSPQYNACAKTSLIVSKQNTNYFKGAHETNHEYTLKNTSNTNFKKKRNDKSESIKGFQNQTKIKSKIGKKSPTKVSSEGLKLKVSLPLKNLKIEQLISCLTAVAADTKYPTLNEKVFSLAEKKTKFNKIDDTIKINQQSGHLDTGHKLQMEESVQRCDRIDNRCTKYIKHDVHLKGTSRSIKNTYDKTESFNENFENTTMKSVEHKDHQQKETNRNYMFTEKHLPSTLRADLLQSKFSASKNTRYPDHENENIKIEMKGRIPSYCIDRQLETNGRLVVKFKRISCSTESPIYESGILKNPKNAKERHLQLIDPEVKTIDPKHLGKEQKQVLTSIRAPNLSQKIIPPSNNDNSKIKYNNIHVKDMMKNVNEDYESSVNQEANVISKERLRDRGTFNNKNTFSVGPPDSSVSFVNVIEMPKHLEELNGSIHIVKAKHYGPEKNRFDEVVNDCTKTPIETLHSMNSLCGGRNIYLHSDTDKNGDNIYEKNISDKTKYETLMSKPLPNFPVENFVLEKDQAIQNSSNISSWVGSNYPIIENTGSLKNNETKKAYNTVTNANEAIVEIRNKTNVSGETLSKISIEKYREIMPISEKMLDTNIMRDNNCSEASYKMTNDALMERKSTKLCLQGRHKSCFDFITAHEKIFDDFVIVLCFKLRNLLFDFIAEEKLIFNLVNKSNLDLRSYKDTYVSNHETYQAKIKCLNRFFLQAFQRICNVTENEKQRNELLIETFVRITGRLSSTAGRTWTLNETRLQLITFLFNDVFHLPTVAETFFRKQKDFLKDCTTVMDCTRGNARTMKMLKLKIQKDNVDVYELKDEINAFDRENYFQSTLEPKKDIDITLVSSWKNKVEEIKYGSFAGLFDDGNSSHKIQRVSEIKSSSHTLTDLKDGFLSIDTAQYPNGNLRSGIFSDRTTNIKSNALVSLGSEEKKINSDHTTNELVITENNKLILSHNIDLDSISLKSATVKDIKEDQIYSGILNITSLSNSMSNNNEDTYEPSTSNSRNSYKYHGINGDNTRFPLLSSKQSDLLYTDPLNGQVNKKLVQDVEYILDLDSRKSCRNQAQRHPVNLPQCGFCIETYQDNIRNEETGNRVVDDAVNIKLLSGNISLTKTNVNGKDNFLKENERNLPTIRNGKGNTLKGRIFLKPIAELLAKNDNIGIISNEPKTSENTFSMDTNLLDFNEYTNKTNDSRNSGRNQGQRHSVNLPQCGFCIETHQDNIRNEETGNRVVDDSVNIKSVSGNISLTKTKNLSGEDNFLNENNTNLQAIRNGKSNSLKGRIFLKPIAELLAKNDKTGSIIKEPKTTENTFSMDTNLFDFKISTNKTNDSLNNGRNQGQRYPVSLPKCGFCIEMYQDNIRNEDTGNRVDESVNIKSLTGNFSSTKTKNFNGEDHFLKENEKNLQAIRNGKSNTLKGRIFLKPIAELLANSDNIGSISKEPKTTENMFSMVTNLLDFNKSTNKTNDSRNSGRNQGQRHPVNLPQCGSCIETSQDNMRNEETSNSVVGDTSQDNMRNEETSNSVVGDAFNIKSYSSNISLTKNKYINGEDNFLKENEKNLQAIRNGKSNTLKGRIFLKPIAELLAKNDNIGSNSKKPRTTGETFSMDTNLIDFEKSTNKTNDTTLAIETLYPTLECNSEEFQESLFDQLETGEYNVSPINSYFTMRGKYVDRRLSLVRDTRELEDDFVQKKTGKSKPSKKVFRSFKKELIKNYLSSTSKFQH